ncbi:Uncharacterised protein [uncultured archaeon]|nr:Uncharacterised protein [uncultured archaeon]
MRFPDIKPISLSTSRIATPRSPRIAETATVRMLSGIPAPNLSRMIIAIMPKTALARSP